MPVGVRIPLVIASFALGAMLAIGCLIAVMFEADGFGGRDGGPRWGYMASLAVGLAASVGSPFLILRWLLPNATKRSPLYFGIAMGVALLLFGFAVKP